MHLMHPHAGAVPLSQAVPQPLQTVSPLCPAPLRSPSQEMGRVLRLVQQLMQPMQLLQAGHPKTTNSQWVLILRPMQPIE